MNEFLKNMFGDLTELPWWGWLVVAVLLIGGAVAFKKVRGTQKVVWNARMLAVGAMCIALSSVLSNIKLFSMPAGGSVTAASMLPIMLFAFVYGPVPGLTVGFVHGVLQFLMGGWFLNVWQMLLEYPIAFAVLGLAGLSIRVIQTPGHTPGSVCLITGSAMFSGDTLFQGSCGRTDLPGGSFPQIRQSLLRLGTMAGNYFVYPGHGSATTLAEEKRYNPYLK